MFQRRTRVEPSRSTHLSWPPLSEKRRRVPCEVRERSLELEAEVRLRVGCGGMLDDGVDDDGARG